MASLLRVPEVAAGASEAILAEWLVEENASFSVGDPIVVIETEKAVVEVEAETSAVFLRALVAGGSEVEVGSPMALIGDEREIGADLDKLLADLGVAAGSVTNTPAPERRDVPDDGAAPEPETAPAPSAAVADATLTPPPSPATTTTSRTVDSPSDPERIFISPIARKMLAQVGLVPADVTGTGPNGRIVRRDVVQAVEASSANPTQSVDTATPVPAMVEPTHVTSKRSETDAELFEDIPHSRLRRAVASRLTMSKQTIPHFYLTRSARLDPLLALRAQLNDVSPQKISVNDLVIRAVAAAHARVPDANVIWTDDAMRRFDSVDISVAIASERGLVTPVLRGVEKSSPSAIAAQVKAFVQQANDGKLQQRDLEGGSISVTNLGMYGVDEFSAIINPPQSAILAVGAGRPAAVVVDGVVEVATVMKLVLSVDHRAIDGALAAEWMAALVEAIEEPLRLLA